MRHLIFAAAFVVATFSVSVSAENLSKAAPKWRPLLVEKRDFLNVAPPPKHSKRELRETKKYYRKRAQFRTVTRDWESGVASRWNDIARELVAKHKTAPPVASRVYALLSVSQYDSSLNVWRERVDHKRRGPSVSRAHRPRQFSYPSEEAALAAASAKVLSALYPSEAASLEQRVRECELSELAGGRAYKRDLSAGGAIGNYIAGKVLTAANTDGSSAVFTGTIPTGAGVWYSSTNTPPLLPLWGQVRPWLLQTGSQFRPAPPPAIDSPEFKAALAEVRQLSDNRTAEQGRIAEFWADGAGTATPPGHWNEIATAVLRNSKSSEARSARVYAFLNIALMDAGICCWDAKYVYWLVRPSQVDRAITTPVGLPNFPAYTSGHSTFSGAAATVLSYFFPQNAQAFHEMAEEAAVSRLYGGIHYRFDSEVGLKGGRMIGELAIARAAKDA